MRKKKTNPIRDNDKTFFEIFSYPNKLDQRAVQFKHV